MAIQIVAPLVLVILSVALREHEFSVGVGAAYESSVCVGGLAALTLVLSIVASIVGGWSKQKVDADVLTLVDKVTLAFRLLRSVWTRAGWSAFRVDHAAFDAELAAANPRFMSAEAAAALISDETVVAFSGVAANVAPSLLMGALRRRHLATSSPRGLTVVGPGGNGTKGKGILRGSLEELALPGLVTRLVVSHTLTLPRFLQLAAPADSNLEVQILPLGIIARLLARLAGGQAPQLVSTVGVGTFVDPRCGRGSPLTPGAPHLVVPDADSGHLDFSLGVERIDAAIINAPLADRKGNLYSHGATVLNETFDMATAAKRGGGVVLAQVGAVVDDDAARGMEVWIKAEHVDAIVVNSKTEQVLGATYGSPFSWLTLQHGEDGVSKAKGLQLARLMCKLANATPTRSDMDRAMARLAAHVLTSRVSAGALVDIGTGLPEEVSSVLDECGTLEQLRMVVETGVFGGVPAPGLLFGASIYPEEMVNTAQAFERMQGSLDAVVLGALEFDEAGDVNVSNKRGDVANYVGPGGFMDLIDCAKLVIFICPFTQRASITVGADGSLSMTEQSGAKLVPRVSEVTFSGARALAAGKSVFYVTSVGLFQLTPHGLQLTALMPGLDMQRHVVRAAPGVRLHQPPGEPPSTVDRSIVAGGEAFALPPLRGAALRVAEGEVGPPPLRGAALRVAEGEVGPPPLRGAAGALRAAEEPPVVLYEELGHVAVFTLNRPAARNAINGKVSARFEALLTAFERNSDMWVGVVASSHPDVFCAGADLKAINAMERVFSRKGGFAGMVQFPRTKPLIAAVDGKALAGGCEIVLACDLVVASHKAVFGLPEVKRSLVAGAGGLFRLPQRLPRQVAMEMLLTGDPIMASRAKELGFVNELVEPGSSRDAALALAGRIVQNAPVAVREAKVCADRMQLMSDDDAFNESNRALVKLFMTPDFREGPRAFLEKREPRWTGRYPPWIWSLVVSLWYTGRAQC